MKRRLLGKSYLPMILLVLVVAAAAGWLLLPTSRAGNRIKQVVLISIDTCRADYLSCYGFAGPITPNIDQLAAEGVLFTNAISPAPITLPAHASMLTGTIPPYHGVHDNMGYHVPDTEVTLAEILRDNGFTTGAIVSAYVLDASFGLKQGFDSYNDSFMAYRNTIGINERRGDETTHLARQWLDEHKDENFFLFLHYYDPHASYDPPGEFAARFAGNPYAGEVAFVDYCIGGVIGKLKELGLYDSTLIVVTSDHGEMLGEHGEDTHAYFIYQSAVRVPLIFKVPGVAKAIIKDPVGLIDIVPTICASLGIESPSTVQGKDLSGYFDDPGPRPVRPFYCESFAPTKYEAAALLGVITGNWKYIHTSRPELYDLSNDPQESNNLVEQLPQRAAAFRRQLEEILQSSVREEKVDSKMQLDVQALERIKGLGYVGSSVREDFQLDQMQDKDDPKDLIEFHLAWIRVQVGHPDVMEEGEQAAVLPDTYDKERAICEELVQRRPDFFGSYLCLGQIAMVQGDFSGAVPHLSEAVRLNPGSFEAHDLLGRSLSRLGEYDPAVEHLKQSLALMPGDPMPHINLGMVFAQQGKLDQAIEQFRLALAINSKLYQAHLNLGLALFLQGQTDKAIEHYQASLKVNPTRAKVHNLLAQARLAQGDAQGAVASLTRTLQLRPDWPSALSNLARIKATTDDPEVHDPEEAIELARRACQLTEFKNARFMVILARCYAEGGRFGDAVQMAQNALELVRSAGQTKNAAEIQKHIERYQESFAKQSARSNDE